MKNAGVRVLSLAVLLVATVLFADDSSTAVSGVFAVDSRTGVRRSAGSVSVGYAPGWSVSGDAAGANVVLERVDHADMFNAETTTVAVCAADAAGTQVIALPAGRTDSFRLIHRTELNGVPVGEPMSADVAIGVASDPGTAFAADSRAGSLEVLARAHGTANLVYDTRWTNDVARLTLAVTDGQVTNKLMSADAVAKGVYPCSLAGTKPSRFLLTFFGADGEVIDVLTSEPFRPYGGLLILLK